MKKILIILLSIISLQFAYAGSCIDITKNLSKWEESSSVLSLQNFLFEKGFLKATPNGYFGFGTFNAVKAYQKSVKLSQVGNVGPATRAVIKKETCTSVSTTSSPATSSLPVIPTPIVYPPVINTQIIPATSTPSIIKTTTTVSYKTPNISRLSSVTFFAGGSRDWDAYLYGTDFSTSTANSIYFQSVNSNRKYFIGDVKSLNGTDLILPRDFTAKILSCGKDCNEAISVGGYYISVITNGLESNTIYTTINSFTASVISGTLNQSIVSKATNAFFGRLSFAVGMPIQLISITPTITTEGFSSGVVKATRIKDEVTGINYLASTNTISAYQSQMMGLYGDLDGPSSGSLMTIFKIVVMDYISRKNTTFSSPILLTTVTAY